MAEAPQHPEDWLPPELRRRLGEMYRAEAKVPPEVDEVILAAGRRRLANVYRFRRLLRWGGAVAAAAAVVTLALWLPFAEHGGTGQGVRPPVAASNASRPQQAKYTMLDAYRLARELEALGKVESKWDVNHDGVVDQKDVDLIAQEAVRLP